MDPNTYFAAAPFYDEEYGQDLQAKVDDYYSFLTSSALAQLWRRSYYSYYGLETDGVGSGFGLFAIGSIHPGGEQGEMARMKINHYANLITNKHNMATESRPALESRAVNSDSASLAAAYLSDGVVEYYFREKKLEVNYRDAVLLALFFGDSFVRMDWDSRGGRKYGAGPNGQPVYDGDIIAQTYNPFDMVRDVTLTSAAKRTWYIARDVDNKFDLAARYPNLRDEILGASSDTATLSTRRFMDPTKIIPQMGSSTVSRESLLIDRFELLHEPTDACPNGRYTIFLQGGLVLFDGPLPFAKMPIYRMSAGEIMGTPFGWTLGFDILGLQQAIDKLYTVVLSNQLAAGVQNFWQPPGNQLDQKMMAGGLTLLESVVKPEALALCQTPAEIFNFIAKIESVMEILSGVSAVSRGQTPENLKSGTALAFVNATSLSFSSGLQNSANQLLEDMGNGLVSILRDFATTPRIATISGKANIPLMKSYTGKDLIPVDRVTVEATAAVSKTTAGKIQIAQDLLQSGLITSPKEYLTVITTGKLEPLYEGDMAEILLVRAENEDLRNGKPAKALRIDQHAFHIAEHKSVLSTPSSRQDLNIVNATLSHIQEHEQLDQMLQQTDPAYLAATKQPPLPFPQPTPPQLTAPQPVRPGPPGIAAARQAPDNTQSGVKPAAMPGLPPGSSPQAQQANAQFKQGA